MQEGCKKEGKKRKKEWKEQEQKQKAKKGEDDWDKVKRALNKGIGTERIKKIATKT